MRCSLPVFMEGGKLENLEKNPRSRDENWTNNKLHIRDAGSRNRARATAGGGRRELSPLRQPCTPTRPPPLKIVYMTGEFGDQLVEQKLFEAIVFTPCKRNLFLRYMVQMYLFKISDKHLKSFWYRRTWQTSGNIYDLHWDCFLLKSQPQSKQAWPRPRENELNQPLRQKHWQTELAFYCSIADMHAVKYVEYG